MLERVFLGWTTTKDKCVLLKDTMQWCWEGLNPQHLGLKNPGVSLIFLASGYQGKVGRWFDSICL